LLHASHEAIRMNRAMMERHVSGLLVAAALSLAAGLSGRAEAAVILTMQQSGSDVIVDGSGSLDLADLQYAGSGSIGLTSSPFNGLLTTGVGPLDFYSGIVGPSSFGTTRFASPTSSGGDAIYVAGVSSELGVPSGYTSGFPLAGSVTFASQTLVSLGVTPGTYVWTWGTGADADSLTLSIGGGLGTSPVPEPASAMLLGAGLLGLGLTAVQRRRGA
jgi:hypothetical protein